MNDRDVAEAISRHIGPEWPEDRARRLGDNSARVQLGVERLDVIATLRALRAVNEDVQEIAGDVIEIAAKETSLTQKALAEALGVPPSVLRGLRG
jgi:DNA-binding transcriptional regulator YiaG